MALDFLQAEKINGGHTCWALWLGMTLFMGKALPHTRYYWDLK